MNFLKQIYLLLALTAASSILPTISLHATVCSKLEKALIALWKDGAKIPEPYLPLIENSLNDSGYTLEWISAFIKKLKHKNVKMMMITDPDLPALLKKVGLNDKEIDCYAYKARKKLGGFSILADYGESLQPVIVVNALHPKKWEVIDTIVHEGNHAKMNPIHIKLQNKKSSVFYKNKNDLAFELLEEYIVYRFARADFKSRPGGLLKFLKKNYSEPWDGGKKILRAVLFDATKSSGQPLASVSDFRILRSAGAMTKKKLKKIKSDPEYREFLDSID